MALLGFVSFFPATEILLMEIAHKFSWLGEKKKGFLDLVPIDLFLCQQVRMATSFESKSIKKIPSFPVSWSLTELLYCCFEKSMSKTRGSDLCLIDWQESWSSQCISCFWLNLRRASMSEDKIFLENMEKWCMTVFSALLLIALGSTQDWIIV